MMTSQRAMMATETTRSDLQGLGQGGGDAIADYGQTELIGISLGVKESVVLTPPGAVQPCRPPSDVALLATY